MKRRFFKKAMCLAMTLAVGLCSVPFAYAVTEGAEFDVDDLVVLDVDVGLGADTDVDARLDADTDVETELDTDIELELYEICDAGENEQMAEDCAEESQQIKVIEALGIVLEDENESDAVLAGTWDELRRAITDAPVGEAVIIEITQNISTPSGSVPVIRIPANSEITIKSFSDEIFSITRTSVGRHFDIFGNLTLENIAIDSSIVNVTLSNRIHGGVQINAGGSLFMKSGSTIKDIINTTTVGGATVMISGDGKLTMEDGSAIRDNFGDGAVRVTGAGVFTMRGGEISGNKEYRVASMTYRGGAVVVDGGKFIMFDGKISDNVCRVVVAGDILGGGVTVLRGSFEMNGGRIHNNLGTRNTGNVGFIGGGVAVNGADSHFIMRGGTIDENSVNDAIIGHGGGGVLVSGSTFIMYNGAIKNNIGESNTSNRGGGGVFLREAATVVMKNGEITENKNGGVRVDSRCTFIMEGGLISHNIDGGVLVASTIGANPGTPVTEFIMYGGEISYNINRGGVRVSGAQLRQNIEAAKFTMNGGIIKGNTANMPAGVSTTFGGGGVHVFSGIFEMNGGEISGNTVFGMKPEGGGGGVAIGGGLFQMNDGIIKNNTATDKNGGGVLVASSPTSPSIPGTFEMTGGKIIGNSSNLNGGGVYIVPDNFDTSRVKIIEGEISGNTAQDGGGIWIATNRRRSLETTESVVFHSNVATKGAYDVGLQTGLTSFGNIRWSGDIEDSSNKSNSILGTHLINNYDIYNTGTIKLLQHPIKVYEYKDGVLVLQETELEYIEWGSYTAGSLAAGSLDVRPNYKFEGWTVIDDELGELVKLPNTLSISFVMPNAPLKLRADWSFVKDDNNGDNGDSNGGGDNGGNNNNNGNNGGNDDGNDGNGGSWNVGSDNSGNDVDADGEIIIVDDAAIRNEDSTDAHDDEYGEISFQGQSIVPLSDIPQTGATSANGANVSLILLSLLAFVLLGRKNKVVSSLDKI